MEKQLLNVLLFQICHSIWPLRRNPHFDCLNRTKKAPKRTLFFIQHICKMIQDCFPPHPLNRKKITWIFSLTNKQYLQKNHNASTLAVFFLVLWNSCLSFCNASEHCPHFYAISNHFAFSFHFLFFFFS